MWAFQILKCPILKGRVNDRVTILTISRIILNSSSTPPWLYVVKRKRFGYYFFFKSVICHIKFSINQTKPDDLHPLKQALLRFSPYWNNLKAQHLNFFLLFLILPFWDSRSWEAEKSWIQVKPRRCCCFPGRMETWAGESPAEENTTRKNPQKNG